MITLPLPKGFEPPEGVSEGQDFDVVATFTLNKGGTITLKAIDDNPVEGNDIDSPEDMKEEQEEAGGEEPGDFLSAVENRVGRE